MALDNIKVERSTRPERISRVSDPKKYGRRFDAIFRKGKSKKDTGTEIKHEASV